MKTLTCDVKVEGKPVDLLNKSVYIGGTPALRRRVGSIIAVAVQETGKVRMTFRIDKPEDYEAVKHRVGEVFI